MKRSTWHLKNLNEYKRRNMKNWSPKKQKLKHDEAPNEKWNMINDKWAMKLTKCLNIKHAKWNMQHENKIEQFNKTWKHETRYMKNKHENENGEIRKQWKMNDRTTKNNKHA